jgi:hypothetical protein
MKQKLSVKNLGLSLAIVSALGMLVLSVFGNLGLYMNGVEAMMQIHLFFNLSFFGVILGMIEAGVFGFVLGVLIAYFYNLVGGRSDEK